MKTGHPITFILLMLLIGIAWPSVLYMGTMAAPNPDTENVGGVYIYNSDTAGYQRQISDPEKALELSWTIYNSNPDTAYLIRVVIRTESPDGWEVSMKETALILMPHDIHSSSLEISPMMEENKAHDSSLVMNIDFCISEINGTVSGNITRTANIDLDITELDTSGYTFLGMKVRDVVINGHTYLEMPAILDNNIVKFVVYLLVYFLAGLFFLFIFLPFIKKLAARTKTHIDDLIVDMIKKPVIIAIFVNGIVGAIGSFDLPPELLHKINNGYNAFLIILFTWLAIKIYTTVLTYLANNHAKKNIQLRHILIPILRKIGAVTIFFFGLAYGLNFLGIDISFLLTGMGIAGLVIAFAAQDTLSNFFAGIFLIIEPKFKVHDVIIFEEDTYEIREIGMRTTVLYDLFKHMLVIVPNNILANAKLVNLTEPDTEIKVKVDFGVAYGSDTRMVEELVKKICLAHPHVLKKPDRSPMVRVSELADSSVNMFVTMWVDHLDNRFAVRSDVLHEIHARFSREGIEIPFPQMDVSLKYPQKGTAPKIDRAVVGTEDVEGQGWSAP